MVIKVKEGKIYEIVWDNGCYDCTDKCTKKLKTYAGDEKNSTMTYENCYGPEISECSADKGNCDPSFYITWFGTDKNDRQLKSSNLAMSKFKQYSIESLYLSVKGIFTE